MKSDLKVNTKIKEWNPKDLFVPVQSVLSPTEQFKLLVDFNDTYVQNPVEKTIVDMFEDQVVRTPDHTAIVFENQLLTYHKLNARSNQLAHYLKSKGVVKETLVPICIERSPEMLIAIIAVLKAGGTYIPIDPEYPLERIDYMVNDAGASLAISSEKCKSKLKDNEGLDIIEVEDVSIINQATDNLKTAIQSQQLAYIIYTSGSTGKPKGVMIEHRNASSFIRWSQHEFSNSKFGMVYACTSMCFDLSIFEMFYPLSIGKPIRLLENGMHISKYLHKDSFVLINTVPSIVNNLLKQGTDLSNISVINMAGEPVSWFINRALNSDKMEVRNLYGPTETTTYSTVFRLKRDKPILIGRPISNTYIYILNNNQNLSPVGTPGEICIGGDGLARGYLNKDELTAQKFVKNPFDVSYSTKIYKTGDLGRWLPDGNIEYLGRLDDQVKIRGYRIELGEIESVLEQSNLFSQAVVMAKEDKEGVKRLVCYMVPTDDFDKEITTAYLRSKLPEYMVPAFWVEMESMPITPNGKINKKALPNPDINELLNTQYVAPRNESEQRLAEIWKKVLAMKRVGIHDSFFELGGDSILATTAAAIMSENLDLEIVVKDLLFYPTIAELARFVSGLRSEALLSAIRFAEEDSETETGIMVSKKEAFFLNEVKVLSNKKRKEKSIIAVQKSGDNIPFFAIPGYFQFRQLSFYLGKNQPFYGFEPSPHKRIEDVALHFIQEMKVIQPKGPYLLCGFCNMSRIAMEMANILISQGESVPLIVMMESYAPEAELSRMSTEYFANKGKDLFRLFKEQTSAGKIKLFFEGVKRMYRYIFEKEKFLNDGEMIDNDRVYIDDALPHTIKSYPGKVVLFRAKNPLPNYSNDPQMGWSKYVTGPIETVTIEGDHQSIFKDPGVKELAMKLSEVLKLATSAINVGVGT